MKCQVRGCKEKAKWFDGRDAVCNNHYGELDAHERVESIDKLPKFLNLMLEEAEVTLTYVI